jgi:hypothetical protein
MRASLLLGLFAVLTGCGGTNPPPPDFGADARVADLASAPPLCSDAQQGDAGIAPSFANVQKLFNQNCIGCHCCNDTLDLSQGVSYAHLVNQSLAKENGVDETCGGTLVTPGDPSKSYLYQKVTTDMPCAGQRMPLNEFAPMPLPACQQDLIRRWIVAGAPMQ